MRRMRRMRRMRTRDSRVRGYAGMGAWEHGLAGSIVDGSACGWREHVDCPSPDSELADSELADSEMADSELADSEMVDSEMGWDGMAHSDDLLHDRDGREEEDLGGEPRQPERDRVGHRDARLQQPACRPDVAHGRESGKAVSTQLVPS